ncbi:MAG: BMP family ABC transporter substrate-binding protein [Erysipelotrichaceae bacterium]|nr:BMP family ABC transporter substrate-binding protein [Erysipelotrichaceae bacterium]
MMNNDYLIAKKLGDKDFHRLINEKKDPFLKSLEDEVKNLSILSKQYVGTFDIPLHMIVGTVNNLRKRSFAENFMPIMNENSEFAYKWNNLFESQVNEGINEPIKVYEYLQNFYVIEGNKRVSVMKFLNNFAIRAEVIRVLPERNSDNELYYEFLDFYSVAPIYEIVFSKKGGYKELAKYLNKDLNSPWPIELVRELEASFLRFYSIFMEKGGYQLSMTAADGLLLYLKTYSIDSLLDKSRNILENRMNLMWNEFLSSDNNEFLLKSTSYNQKNWDILHLFNKPSYDEKHPLKVAFIHNDDEKALWIKEHVKGVNYINNVFENIVLCKNYFNCDSDNAVKKAVDEAISWGAKVIFGTSSTIVYSLLNKALEHKDIKFFDCALNIKSNAIATYYGRMFEAKFLMGILAAQLADNHKIAYIADAPVYGTIANLNAFALGVSTIDPKASVYVDWSGKKDFDYNNFILKNDIKVISGKDSEEENATYGVYKINEDGTYSNYGSAYFKWGKYYELILKPIIYGNNEINENDIASLYWWGIKEGVLDIRLSKELSYYSLKTINGFKNEIISGNYSIFEGKLISQEGIIAREFETLDYKQIIGMDWLNDNIVGVIPKISELNDGSQKLFEVSGIRVKK